MPPRLLSLYFPASLLPLLLQLTRSHLLVSSKAETQNITTCFISSPLSSCQQPEKILPERAAHWAECSALGAHWREKGKERGLGRHTDTCMRTAMTDWQIKGLGRWMSWIRADYIQLDYLSICFTRQSTAAEEGPRGLFRSKVADKAHGQVLVRGQREERTEYLGRDLGNRKTKKAGTDLGTDCAIKWSWR